MDKAVRLGYKLVLNTWLVWCVLLVVGCSSSTQGSSQGVASPQLAIDNAATVPVISGSATTSVIYVHNNGDSPIKEISYTADNSASDGVNLIYKQFKLMPGCTTIESHSSCALSFTTPTLTAPNIQGSSLITASYTLDGTKHAFSQLINYRLLLEHSGSVINASTNASLINYANQSSYATLYVYNLESTTSIIDINTNNANEAVSNNSLSLVNILNASNNIVAVEVAKAGSNQTHTNNLLIVKSKNKDAKTREYSFNLNATPQAGPFLVIGRVPIINTLKTESASINILNIGNSPANITINSTPSNPNLPITINPEQCPSTLAANGNPGNSCTLNFTVPQAGSSSDIAITYTNGRGQTTTVTQTIMWYNPNNDALLAMNIAPSMLNLNVGQPESVILTATNIGGFNLSSVTPTNANGANYVTTLGHATASISSLNCYESNGNLISNTSLPINGYCQYNATLDDESADATGNMDFFISGNYTNSNGAQTYNRQLNLSYTSSSPGFQVLFTFSNATLNGSGPNTLIQGTDGNLYGTTSSGGESGDGTLFRMTSYGEESIIYSFPGTFPDNNPTYLVQDSEGNFYATVGGDGNGCGSIFKITPTGTATTFFSGNDVVGCSFGPLYIGNNKTIYVLSLGGGVGECGNLFQINQSGIESEIHPFFGKNNGACGPTSVVQTSNGNLYGTTLDGGDCGYGTAFSISANGDYSNIHSFCNTPDGEFPQSLLKGSDGNLYGITTGGGESDNGTIFKITPAGQYSILYSFTSPLDGKVPITLIQGNDGNFYGTTVYGGNSGDGTIYMVTLDGQQETALYSFSVPYTFFNTISSNYNFIQDSAGNFYGEILYLPRPHDNQGIFWKFTL